MPLRYGFADVENYKELCWDKVSEEGEEDEFKLNPVTNHLIWGTMLIGISCITEKNVEKFYNRMKAHEDISGAQLMRKSDSGEWEPRNITKEEIEAHIGLWTNASTKTAAQFKKSLINMIEPESGF